MIVLLAQPGRFSPSWSVSRGYGEPVRSELLRVSAAEHRGKGGVTVTQHRLPVRDENPLDGKLEQRPEGVAQPLVVDRVRQPRGGAEAETAVARAEDDV